MRNRSFRYRKSYFYALSKGCHLALPLYSRDPLNSGLHTERHYTPTELGELWVLSSETIWRLSSRAL
jgi:hypothetical protein